MNTVDLLHEFTVTDSRVGDALLTAFQGCSDALDNGATPSVVHNSDGTISFIHYPAICAEEAEAYAPTGGETITVNGGIITVGNAPADFLATLHA